METDLSLHSHCCMSSLSSLHSESGAGRAVNSLGWPMPLTYLGLPLHPHEQSSAARAVRIS
jgi:hypothetical protein